MLQNHLRLFLHPTSPFLRTKEKVLCYKHCQNVLQSKWYCFFERHSSIKFIDVFIRAVIVLFFHLLISLCLISINGHNSKTIVSIILVNFVSYLTETFFFVYMQSHFIFVIIVIIIYNISICIQISICTFKICRICTICCCYLICSCSPCYPTWKNNVWICCAIVSVYVTFK